MSIWFKAVNLTVKCKSDVHSSKCIHIVWSDIKLNFEWTFFNECTVSNDVLKRTLLTKASIPIYLKGSEIIWTPVSYQVMQINKWIPIKKHKLNRRSNKFKSERIDFVHSKEEEHNTAQSMYVWTRAFDEISCCRCVQNGKIPYKALFTYNFQTNYHLHVLYKFNNWMAWI